MSRLDARFASLKEQGKRAFITFITAGDPEPKMTVSLLHHLVAEGADVLELGMPFSDPMADGPVVQKANERALAHHMGLSQVLQLVVQFRQQDKSTPIVLMGYLNPIECMGFEKFAAQANAAGVDGLIIVDMPPEEADEVIQVFEEHDLAPVFLLAPTSSDARIQRACELAKGFVYYVSLRGVTGAQVSDYQEIADQVAKIRKYTSLPVGVGFGIRDGATATAMGRHADALVVGSALVNCVEKYATDPHTMKQAMSQVMRDIRAAIDGLPALEK
ncbi:MAG TPA: tryptophan synthase subunit alpha [Gammaproteobacteria bacterium]|nr:tryptophan synthase subunit alpha [Gammaproteobacteria bacterium]